MSDHDHTQNQAQSHQTERLQTIEKALILLMEEISQPV